MTYVMFGLYSLFAVTTVSAVFGTAVAVTSSYLLFFASCWVLWIKRSNIEFLLAEKLAFGLVIWLLIAAIVRPNALEGVEFVLKEYRLLWMAPVIALALSKSFSRAQLWAPPIVGTVFHFIGSALLVAAKWKTLAWPWAKDIVDVLGLKANGKGTYYALNGKFIQAWLMTLWSGLAMSWLSARDRMKSALIACVLALLIILGILHGSQFANARSGVLSTFFVLAVLAGIYQVWLCRLGRKRTSLVLILILIMSLYTASENLPRKMESQLARSWDHTVAFFVEGREASSIGARLVVWSRLEKLDSDQWIIGVGAGNWEQTLDTWFPPGSYWERFAIWNDFHSQLLWLIVKGGLLALALYVAMVIALVASSVRQIFENNAWALGGLGLGLATVLVVTGSMNSVFTALREAHLTGLALILWGALERLHSPACSIEIKSS